MKKGIINQARSWVFVSCLLFPIQRAAAQFVEISAEIEYVAYRTGDPDGVADARNAKPMIISVSCIAGTNAWRIEHDYISSGVEKWLFNGTNVYHNRDLKIAMSEEMKQEIAKTSGLATPPSEAVKSNVTIRIDPSRDGHPLGDKAVNIAWLAFCSGAYLKREGRIIPLPVDELRHTPDRFAYSDKTETFNNEFGLPRTVDLFTSRSRFETSVNDFHKEYSFGDRYSAYTKRTAASLQEGVLTFHYAVTESTNFLGRTFPTRFEFFQNGRKYVENGDWFHRGIGRVKSIRASARP